MTWRHEGRVHAFKAVTLDYKKSQELEISGFKQTDSSLYFADQAIKMLATMYSYDQEMVLKEIRQIIRFPYNQSSTGFSRNFFRRIYRYKIPYKHYHFLIRYRTDTNHKVLIDDILFDYQLPGSRDNSSRERSMLYTVDQIGEGIYKGNENKEQIQAIEDSWFGGERPTVRVTTRHVTVNGMLNDLQKASWLMGVHTQTAYPDDKVKSYTLFHNPTDGALLDLMECNFDKVSGRKSHNAQQLASIIAGEASKPIKWTVHSQGAIIFLAALDYFSAHHNQSLYAHELVIHGSGANMNKLQSKAKSLGIKINTIRNNPFDGVPNIAGGVARNHSGLWRSLRFLGLVIGENPLISPHTLPYLGLESYCVQLELAGKLKEAKIVQRYIDKNCK